MLRKYRIELLVILIVHMGFLFIQMKSGNYLVEDSTEYIQAAENILNEGILYCGNPDLNTDPALNTKRLLVYPLLILAFQSFSTKLFPIILFQLFLSVGSFLLMLRIFNPNKESRLILLGLIVFFPVQFIYTTLVMPEILFQFILMLAVIMILGYIQTGRIRILWYYQALLVTGILIKPELWLFIIPNILLFIILYFKSRQRLVLISSLIPLVFLIILGGINQKRTGYFHVSSIQQIMLVDNKLRSFIADRDGEEQADELLKDIHRNCEHQRDLKERSKCFSSSAVEYIKNDLLAYSLFHMRGMAKFFLDQGRSEISNFFATYRLSAKAVLHQQDPELENSAGDDIFSQPILMKVVLVLILLFNIIRIVGFLFFLFNKNIKSEFRLFLFLLVFVLAFSAGPLGTASYMLPIALLLTGSAAVQYGKWLFFLRRKNIEYAE